MRTQYGVSPWIAGVASSRRPAYPPLRGEHAADVVIVGGGLTGCATAYACAAAGLSPIVVEAERIGQSESGRSAGLLLPEPGPAFADLARAHGLRHARHVFEAWRRAALDGAAVLRRVATAARPDPCDTLIVAGAGDERALRREYEARNEAGLKVGWLTRRQVAQVTALDGAAALRMHDGFGVDPYRSVLALARAAARRGATLFERSPVSTIGATPTHARVVAGKAVIRAGTVIVATGTPTAAFAPLQRHFKRREGYLALTEPLPAAMRKQLGSRDATLRDMRVPPHRLRWTRDARMLVAGADQDATPARARSSVLVQRTGQLMYELLTMYPAISGLRPEIGWERSYGDTADGLPYVGPHRHYPRHLFALGGGGDSVTGAFLAARILLRAVRGEPGKQDEVFGFAR